MYFSKTTSCAKYILLAVLFLIGLSCSYYKPVLYKNTNTRESGDFISSKAGNKYFILRQDSSSYALKDIVVDKENLALSGILSDVDSTHQIHIRTSKYIKPPQKLFRYKETDSDNILNEIHIYIKNTQAIDATKSFVLPLGQIEKIEIIKPDKERTALSYLGGAGIGLIVLLSVIGGAAWPW